MIDCGAEYLKNDSSLGLAGCQIGADFRGADASFRQREDAKTPG